jgi:hypothetical protein
MKYVTFPFAADADDAARAGWIVICSALVVPGLGIRNVQHVVLVDGDPGRPAELLPLLVEDHDPAVAAVGDVEVVLSPSSSVICGAPTPDAARAARGGDVNATQRSCQRDAALRSVVAVEMGGFPFRFRRSPCQFSDLVNNFRPRRSAHICR